MKKGIFAFLLLAVCHFSSAKPYSYEVSLDYQQTETDFSETDTTAVRGTYYWKPVTANDVPLSEAAFVARASSVSLGFENRNADVQTSFIEGPLINFNPPDLSMLPADSIANVFSPDAIAGVSLTSPVNAIAVDPAGGTEVLSGAVHFVSDSGWIGDLAYSRSDYSRTRNSINFANTLDSELDTLRFGFGKYVGSATTVEFEYQDTSTETDSTSSLLAQPGITTFPPAFLLGPTRNSTDASIKGYSVKARSLLGQGEYTHAVGVVVGYDVLETDFSFESATSPLVAFPNSVKSYALRTGFDYVFYPRNDLGLGLAYSVADAEFGKDKALSLAVEWFITPKVALQARYLSIDTPSSFTDADGFGLGVAGRF